jgi:hypothetical protein
LKDRFGTTIAKRKGVAQLQTATQRGCVGLLVAHPGHEVSLYGWLQKNRPTVFVLTDGSDEEVGSTLAVTTQLLERARARPGSVYGRFTGTAVSRAMLRRDVGGFAAVIHELVDWLSEQPVRYLVTDAAEGRDPAHDLCRTIAGVAVELTGALTGRAIPLYEYAVSGDRQPCARGQCRGSTRWHLDDDTLARKVSALQQHARLAADGDAACERDGPEAYRVECLHHVAPRAPWRSAPGEAPVAATSTTYASLIRHREHIVPLQSDLWAMAAVPRPRAAVRA